MKLLPGVYNANLVISRKLDVHGDAATVIPAGTTGPLLHAMDGAELRVYGLTLVNENDGTQTYGFLCDSSDGISTPNVQLDRVVIESADSPGFIIQCKLDVSRSTLKSPRTESDRHTFIAITPGQATFDRSNFIGGGGIAGYGGHITISNSVVDEVLGPTANGGLWAIGGSVSVSFSTIANSRLSCGASEIPACASGARVGVCIENSIINNSSSLGDSFTGNNCHVSYSIVSPQQGSVPGENNMIGVTPSFKDPANKDFHLNADSPAINAANPAAVATPDYDGVMRPQGGRSDIGAFEFKE